MRILRKLFYPGPGALNQYNLSVEPFTIKETPVEETVVMTLRNRAGRVVGAVVRFGTRMGLTHYVGCTETYVDQEKP